MTYPDNKVLKYAYDGRDDLTGITQNGVSTPIVSYAYDNTHCTSRTLGNGVASAYGYDTLERLSSVSDTSHGTILQSFSYAYDALSRVSSVKRETGLGDVYGYDTADQLNAVEYSASNPDTNPTNPVRTVGYAYDGAGNRTEVNDSLGSPVAYLINPDITNQYASVGGSPVSYDGAGNLKTYLGWTYTYDAYRHLTGASNGTVTLSYYYDALGRCVAQYSTATQVTTYYVYGLGWNVLEEFQTAVNSQPLTGNTSETQRYLRGGGTDEIVSKVDLKANMQVYYSYDGVGNVTKLTDTSGNLLEQYSYDVYGAPTIMNSAGTVLSATAYTNRFLFHGREYDAATTLYHYRNRDYTPGLGRFLQPDPIGHVGDAYNIYRFCGNDPVNQSDPSGLDSGGAGCDDGGDGSLDEEDGGCCCVDPGNGDPTGGGGGGEDGSGPSSGGNTSSSSSEFVSSDDFSADSPDSSPDISYSISDDGDGDDVFSGSGGNFGVITGNENTLSIGSSAAVGSNPWNRIGGSANALMCGLVEVTVADLLTPGLSYLPASTVSTPGAQSTHDPSKADYTSVNFNIAIPIPWAATLFGVSFTLNIDRYGDWFFGIGPGFGKSTTVVSASVTNNFLTQPGATRAQMTSFLTQSGFNGTAAFGIAYSESYTPGSGWSSGAGIGSPQIGGSYNYSFQGPGNTGGW